jgi:hypothetical protein
MIIGSGVIGLLLSFLVICIVLGLFWYIFTNFAPEPIKRFGTVVFVVICGILLIWLIYAFASSGLASPHHLG